MTTGNIAADYVLGSLSPLERREVERLRLSDHDLDAQIAKLEAQMAPLAGDAGEIAPPECLFDRIAAAVAREATAASALHKLPFAAGEWSHYSDGIEVKYLWDAETFLMRCLPGAVIPPHGHDLAEHLIVVSGDLVVDGVEFGLGDYHSMPPGTRHDDARTRQGCILFVQSRA